MLHTLIEYIIVFNHRIFVSSQFICQQNLIQNVYKLNKQIKQL